MKKRKSGIADRSIGRFVILLVLAGLLFCTTACGSKETVLLETEDIVWEDEEAEEENVTAQTEEQVEESTLFVHICGAVQNPGVYELPLGSRIYEAVETAGGFCEDACEDYVNMASLLEDGLKVDIPTIDESKMIDENKGMGMQSDGLININTATKAELCTLSGIGESRADSIIAYREKNGNFSEIEDIMKIEGIKEGMFSKIKEKICVR